VSNLRLKPLDRDTRETRKQQVILAEGVIQELYSCRDASRGWTGNWDNEMIRRVEKRAGIDRLDKRQCLALREILKDMYEVISQGGNDILEVRHTLQDIQRQYVAKQRTLTTRTPGQRSIRDWLHNSRGISGSTAKHNEAVTLALMDEDVDDAIGSDSDEEDIQDTTERLQGSLTYVQEAWIPQLSNEETQDIADRIQDSHHNQILALVDKTAVRTEHMRRLIYTHEVAREIVDAYGRRLQASHTRRFCKFFPTSFFEKLVDPNGTINRQEKGVLNISRCKGYTTEINIFEYQLLLIPVMVDKHWTLVAADMNTRQVRYLDPAGAGGLAHLLAIRRWLASEWKRFYRSAFPAWRSILSEAMNVPQQGPSNACGIFTIMFMQLLADGQDVQRFSMEAVREASYYIAYRILHQVQPRRAPNRITYKKVKDSGRVYLMNTKPSPDRETEVADTPAPVTPGNEDTDRMGPIPDLQVEEDTTEKTGDIDSKGDNQLDEKLQTTLRRSERRNKFTGSMTEREGLPWNHNADRLQIQSVSGMGWCLFAMDQFDKDEPIAVYAGKTLKPEVARSAAYKSDYIVELGELFIDAWDARAKLCTAFAGYANDAINKHGRRDCWNAEFILDPDDDRRILLRATRPINKGEQIYAWYGPTYWCDDTHPLELMKLAVLTYGVNIKESTWETDGDWKSLAKYDELLLLLEAEGYVPPEITANPFKQTSPPAVLLHPISEATGDIRDLVSTVESRRNKRRKEPQVQQTSVVSASGDNDESTLLLGMVYTKSSLLNSKLQLTRDGIRCRVLEHTERVPVYTIDVGHTVDQAVDGRHIQQDFTKYSVLGEMDRRWSGKIFKHVIMDYFYTPSSWHAERWGEAMYTLILPTMAAKGAIPLGGEVWLPHIQCIAERLERLWKHMQPYFHKVFVPNPTDNPLYRATEIVEAEIEIDGNTFTNASALKELPLIYPFILLTCTNSGDKLGSSQRKGCGSLEEQTMMEASRTLRARPPQVNTSLIGKKRTCTKRDLQANVPRTTETIDLTERAPGAQVTQEAPTEAIDYRLIFPDDTADTRQIERELALSDTTPLNVVDRHHGLPVLINREDIRRSMGDMLNDSVIDTYLKLLCQSNLQYQVECLPTSYAPFVYADVQNPGQNTNLTRDELFHRIRNFDLFTCDVLISPIITGLHITAVIADKRNKEVIHVDSLGNGNRTYAIELRDMLQEHWDWRVAQGGPEEGTNPMQGWTCRGATRSEAPQQQDGVACGVYSIAFATLRVLQIPWQYM